jgi:hypothetical protein
MKFQKKRKLSQVMIRKEDGKVANPYFKKLLIASCLSFERLPQST